MPYNYITVLTLGPLGCLLHCWFAVYWFHNSITLNLIFSTFLLLFCHGQKFCLGVADTRGSRILASYSISLILGCSHHVLHFIKRKRINSLEALLISIEIWCYLGESHSSDVYNFNFIKYRWTLLWLHQLITFA